MCGIAGLYSTEGRIDEMQNLVEKILASQYRRGPDYQAFDTVAAGRGTLCVGSNRLSIIDLSPEANQPMWDNERRYCLVFNGEVYNYVELKKELSALGHRFSTRSDSEVILESFKEWGVGAAERFNGMFAFALFDTAEGCLYLFRDRFGVKPLYYFVDENNLYFASTCQVIARYLGLKPNLEYISRGVRLWIYEGGEISPFVGLKALKPAHYLKVKTTEAGKVEAQLNAYYHLDERVASLTDSLARRSTQELVNLVSELLEDAIDLRFRADVPVGVSLSGGLDSSTIAALSHSSGRGDVRGFTWGHPEDRHTEGPFVQQLRDHTDMKVSFVRAGMPEITTAYFEALDAQGAPYWSASGIGQYLLFKAVRKEGVKVLLGGQGGDEIFMGYRKFLVFYLRQLLWQRRTGEALAFALGLLRAFAAERGRLQTFWRTRHRYTNRGWGMDTVLNLPEVRSEYISSDPAKPLWVRQMYDVMFTSLPSLLRFEDGMSMGNSVESRLPFMDYRLVEVALALPVAVKLRDGYGKWIVREVARGRIPEEIRTARWKRGFDVQLSDWIGRGLGAAIREAVQERLSETKQFLKPGTKVDEVFSDPQLKRREQAFCEATTLIWLGDNVA